MVYYFPYWREKRSRIIKYICILLLAITSIEMSKAQASFALWGDVGNSNIDNNGFSGVSLTAGYEMDKWHANFGQSLIFSEWRERSNNGTRIELGRDFTLKGFNFKTSVLYLHKPFSKEMKEWDLGILLSKEYGKLQYALGTHHRQFVLNTDREEDHISEGFNFLYSISYHHLFQNEQWELSAEVTNYDYFLLNQETNPMVNIAGHFFGVENLDVFAEIWYKQAGLLNIQVQHFGYLFRLGAKWDIDI